MGCQHMSRCSLYLCVRFIGEETAIELIKMGAVDYVLKDRPDRLPFAVRRAINEANEKAAANRLKRNTGPSSTTPLSVLSR